MTGNEAAELATEAMPYVTAAVGAYGGAVLAKASDDAAGATVRAGTRLLQRVFGRKEAGDPLPEPLADVVAHPGDGDFGTVLKAAIRKALERDAAMLAEVRSVLAKAPEAAVTQHVHAGRDAYVSARDMTVNQSPG